VVAKERDAAIEERDVAVRERGVAMTALVAAHEVLAERDGVIKHLREQLAAALAAPLHDEDLSDEATALSRTPSSTGPDLVALAHLSATSPFPSSSRRLKLLARVECIGTRVTAWACGRVWVGAYGWPLHTLHDELRVHDENTGALLASVSAGSGNGAILRSLSLSCDGRLMLLANESDTIHVVDCMACTVLGRIVHVGRIFSAVFAREDIIVCGTNENDRRHVAALSYPDGVELWVYESTSESFLHVGCVAASPSGELVAVTCKDSCVSVLSVSTGEVVEIMEHFHPRSRRVQVDTVAFSHDGMWLASSFDMRVMLWDTMSWELKWQSVELPLWALAIVFSPDDNFVVANTSGGAVVLISVETGAVEELAEGGGLGSTVSNFS
jgi:WD40 repeat protein